MILIDLCCLQFISYKDGYLNYGGRSLYDLRDYSWGTLERLEQDGLIQRFPLGYKMTIKGCSLLGYMWDENQPLRGGSNNGRPKPQ